MCCLVFFFFFLFTIKLSEPYYFFNRPESLDFLELRLELVGKNHTNFKAQKYEAQNINPYKNTLKLSYHICKSFSFQTIERMCQSLHFQIHVKYWYYYHQIQLNIDPFFCKSKNNNSMWQVVVKFCSVNYTTDHGGDILEIFSSK